MTTEFEKFVELRLKEDQSMNGEDVWASYLVTKKELVEQVISVIGNVEPNLSDHCEPHIENVMENIGSLIGLEANQIKVPMSTRELLASLLGALMHDIGNIEGRAEHHKAITKVLSQLDLSGKVWAKPDIQAVNRICKAHTGKTEDGSRDTIGPLANQRTPFLGKPIQPEKVAALLRYADELAEGPQRTSKYLMRTEKYGQDSELFHRYASVTHMNIDFNAKKVFADYHVDIEAPELGNKNPVIRKNLNQLIRFCHYRASKLEHERRYNSYHAPDWIMIRETSVNFSFTIGLNECDASLSPIVLNDLATYREDSGKPFALFKSHKVNDLVKQLMDEKAGV